MFQLGSNIHAGRAFHFPFKLDVVFRGGKSFRTESRYVHGEVKPLLLVCRRCIAEKRLFAETADEPLAAIPPDGKTSLGNVKDAVGVCVKTKSNLDVVAFATHELKREPKVLRRISCETQREVGRDLCVCIDPMRHCTNVNGRKTHFRNHSASCENTIF